MIGYLQLWHSWEEAARMYFKLLRRNSKRSRKENGIYLASLIISIIAFYIILSLENQDVMKFLVTMESDAVDKLMGLIPVLYVMSLVIIFFLVYFATKYQLDRRNHEFGLYLMMGMKRSRLFLLLLAEDFLGSLFALMVGIPLAVLLSEFISLITARLVGLGIIGHQFTISVSAIGWTAAGFLAVKVAAHVVLSGRLVGKEPLSLLKVMGEEKLKPIEEKKVRIRLVEGILFLLPAYGMAVTGISWMGILGMGVTLLFGVAGTFLLFQGISLILGKRASRRRKAKGLDTFTFRQLQENVCLRSGSMAAASLLMVAAICCLGFGVSMMWSNEEERSYSVDFTFQGEEDEVRNVWNQPELKEKVDVLFELRTGLFYSGEAYYEEGEEIAHTFDASEFLEAAEKLKKSKERDILVNNLGYFVRDMPYLIAESGYNEILRIKGEEPLELGEGEIAIYEDPDFSTEKLQLLMEDILESSPQIVLDGEVYSVRPGVYTDNIVTDRSISLSMALIVRDEDFLRLRDGDRGSSFWNVKLREDYIAKKGQMQAISEVNELLKDCPLEYESYLQNMGRQLFYAVAASYTTIYLAVIFFVISNTVLAVQFLMQQKKTGRRYQTLAVLGASDKRIYRSSSVQVKWYFGLPVAVAVASGIVGVASLCSSVTPSAFAERIGTLFLGALVVTGIIVVVECFYIKAVKKLNYRYIWEMMQTLPRE